LPSALAGLPSALAGLPSALADGNNAKKKSGFSPLFFQNHIFS